MAASSSAGDDDSSDTLGTMFSDDDSQASGIDYGSSGDDGDSGTIPLPATLRRPGGQQHQKVQFPGQDLLEKLYRSRQRYQGDFNISTAALSNPGNQPVGQFIEKKIDIDGRVSLGGQETFRQLISDVGPLMNEVIQLIQIQQRLTTTYLTPEFISYLRDIANGEPPPSEIGSPPDLTLCDFVLFGPKHARDSIEELETIQYAVNIEMLTFARMLIPREFSTRASGGSPPYLRSIISRRRGSVSSPASSQLQWCVGTDSLTTRPYWRDPSPDTLFTIQDAYRQLHALSGSPIQRYFSFLEFVYIFFDAIPGLRRAIDSLIRPLYVMTAVILLRGHPMYQPSSFLTLTLEDLTINPAGMARMSFYYNAQQAFSTKSTIEVACKSVIRMFKNIYCAYTAIYTLISDQLSGLTQIGYHENSNGDFNRLAAKLLEEVHVKNGEQTVNPDSVAKAKQAYDRSGALDFLLPTGSPNTPKILTRLLGLSDSDIRTKIFELALREFSSDEEYNRARDTLRTANSAREYRSSVQESKNRIGYFSNTLLALPLQATALSSDEGSIYVRVTPYQDVKSGSLEYIYPWMPPKDVHRLLSLLPRSWDELLLCGYLGHVACPPNEPDYLRVCAATIVRPCVITSNYSMIFNCDFESQGYVESIGVDLENIPSILTAMLEFPAQSIHVKFTAPNQSIGPAMSDILNNTPLDNQAGRSSSELVASRVGTASQQQGYSEQVHGTKIHRLVEALNIHEVIGDDKSQILRAYLKNTIESSSLTPAQYESFAVMNKRTTYLWTSLPLSILKPAAWPASAMRFSETADIFFPALDADFFLSSFFDWRLQIFYLLDVRDMLRGRELYQTKLDAIDRALTTGFTPEMDREVQKAISDSDSRKAYIKANVLRNLITAPVAAIVQATYTGFVNFIFARAGSGAPSSLAAAIKNSDLIDSTVLTPDARRFFASQKPVPERSSALEYDVTLTDYIDLLNARKASSIRPTDKLVETDSDKFQRFAEEAQEKNEESILTMLEKSKAVLSDDYSQLINAVVTRSFRSRK